MVGWLGDLAEGGARGRQQWGGRWEAYSGEQVERLGLQAGVQALWVREEALGVLNWPRARAERGAPDGGNGDRGGARVLARGMTAGLK
jgi:hypothetical protein